MILFSIGLTVILSFLFCVRQVEKNMRRIYRKVDEKSFHFRYKIERRVTRLKRTCKRTVETCSFYIRAMKRKVEKHGK